ncbi:MAG: DUF2946 family protein [Burkholderiales bacterium]|nr:DUF2946 family protein [Burkholderiales bacterium]
MRWLAVLIALFGALAPTLSHALALTRSSGPAWAEVCTSAGTGTRWIAPDNTASAAPVSADLPDGQESLPSLVHCPLCLLLAAPALPASPFSPRFVTAPDTREKPAARPVLFSFARFAFRPPPRGPPAVS